MRLAIDDSRFSIEEPQGGTPAPEIENHKSKIKNPTCLVIAYHFPPLVAAGTHRTRAFVRHLPELGWTPVVLTVKPSETDVLDPRLLAGLPDDLACYRTRWTNLPAVVGWLRRWLSALGHRLSAIDRKEDDASDSRKPMADSRQPIADQRGWKDWLSRWWHVPDSRLGWLPWGVASGYRVLRRHRCRAIFSTAPYWTSQLIGLALHRLSGLPWVADFRDPWRPNPFRQFPYAGQDRYDSWLEGQVIRHATWVVCNTPGVERALAGRYPELAEKFVTILNGVEREDFADLTLRRPVAADRFVLTHTGDFYGERRPDAILAALKVLRKHEPAIAARIHLQLVGPPDCNGEPLVDIVARYGLSDQVSVTGLLPQREARERLAGSDALLLMGFIGPGAELQAPSKLYDYLAVGKPIVALSSRDSAIAEVLAEAGDDYAILDPDDTAGIAEMIGRFASRPRQINARALPEKMTRAYQARQLAELLLGHRLSAAGYRPDRLTALDDTRSSSRKPIAESR